MWTVKQSNILVLVAKVVPHQTSFASLAACSCSNGGEGEQGNWIVCERVMVTGG